MRLSKPEQSSNRKSHGNANNSRDARNDLPVMYAICFIFWQTKFMSIVKMML